MKTSGAAGLAALGAAFVFAAASPAAAADKIPITTSSDEARQLYLEGRDLNEKLRATDARVRFEKAAAKDPGFALAQVGLANTSGTAKEFFEGVDRAVALAGKASESEKLLICALDAGAKGEPARQSDCLTKLIAAHPDDERAHNLMGAYHFGRQDYAAAVEEYKKATAINPAVLAALQPDGLRLPLHGQERRGRAGLQEVHRADPRRPEPLRLLRGAAHEARALRRVDQELREGALRRPQLRGLVHRHREQPRLPGPAAGGPRQLRQAGRRSRATTARSCRRTSGPRSRTCTKGPRTRRWPSSRRWWPSTRRTRTSPPCPAPTTRWATSCSRRDAWTTRRRGSRTRWRRWKRRTWRPR